MIESNTNQRKADTFIDCYLCKELQAAFYLLTSYTKYWCNYWLSKKTTTVTVQCKGMGEQRWETCIYCTIFGLAKQYQCSWSRL